MNGNIRQINGNIQQLTTQSGIQNASIHNIRLAAQNRLANNTMPNIYQPLLKTRVGHGLALATAIFQDVNQLQPFLVQPPVEPVIGTAPPGYSNDFRHYNRSHIIRLIIFYNEDFGIVKGDTVDECIRKLQAFFVAY